MSARRYNGIRLLLALAALFGAFAAPFWVPLLCMVLLSLRFSAWEVPLLGLLVDLLWLPSVGFLTPFPYFTVGGILIVLLFEPLRREFLV